MQSDQQSLYSNHYAGRSSHKCSLHIVILTTCPTSHPPEVCETCWESLFGPKGRMASMLANPSDSWYDPEKGFNYTTSNRNIHRAAASGCRWCKLIMDDQWSWIISYLKPDDESPVEIGITVYTGENRLKTQELNLRIGPMQTEKGTTYCCYTKQGGFFSSLSFLKSPILLY